MSAPRTRRSSLAVSLGSIDREVEVDHELVRTGPYRRECRALVPWILEGMNAK
jgi:hypothetical protein